MHKFALIELTEIKGKQKFYKLMKNGRCEFDEFEEKFGVIYQSEMRTVIALMQRVANLLTLPPKKFKDITPKKDKVKEYEIKTHNLRVYLIHDISSGKLIISGGTKNTQENDINHFRELKKQYLKQVVLL